MSLRMRALKQDKGVVGLNLLLGVVVMLFIIGFLVMIFVIMGGEVEESAWSDVSGTVTNVTISSLQDATTNTTGSYLTEGYQYYDEQCTVSEVTNSTSGAIVPSTNYTVTGCVIWVTNVVTTWNSTEVNVTYTYTAQANSTASGVIVTTSDELSDTTDWFGIIIVISAMVILILLTALIISAIRGTGFVAGGGSSGTGETA